MSTLATVHLFSWAFVWGGSGYYSYVASPIAFKTLPRQEFGKLQNQVFPHFFLGQTLAPVAIALTAPYSLSAAALWTLGVAAVGGATNAFWLLPVTRGLKEQRLQLEEEGQGPETEQHIAVTQKFGKLHAVSLLFNAVNFVALTTYGFILTKNIIRYVPK
jgi:hypothetical protein